MFRYFSRHFRLKEIVDPSFRLGPLSQDEPPVKHAGVQPFIPPPDLLCQRRIVLHGKMQPQAVPLFRFQNPGFVKPVAGSRGVAVEPKTASRHRAAGAGLFHKGLWHQRHLVQQDPRKGDALNQACRAFVPSSEDVVLILPPQEPDRHQILRPFFLPLGTQFRQLRQDLRQYIASQGSNGLTADAEFFPVKAALGPQEESQPHGQRLSGTDCPVADNGFHTCGFLSRYPPGQYCPLFGRKSPVAHASSPP